jgi:RNA polymerase sigma factor (sigma-70 family)
MVTADLLSRARAGDGEAFRELTESHRRELQVHCYRMLGSVADAEDPVQETMLAAWRGIGGFTEERASLRTWLYKIATNRCLNARRAASRCPARDMSQFQPPLPRADRAVVRAASAGTRAHERRWLGRRLLRRRTARADPRAVGTG